jgi:hypothetical protein
MNLSSAISSLWCGSDHTCELSTALIAHSAQAVDTAAPPQA